MINSKSSIPWKTIFVVSIIGGILGVFFAIITIEMSLKYALWGFRDGVALAFAMTYYSLVIQNKLIYLFLNQWAFLARVAFNTFVYALIFLAIRLTIDFIEDGLIGIEWNKNLWSAMVFALVTAALINFVFEVIRLIGGRVAWSFISGAYRKPIEENRYFLFIDLAHSTTLAEKLGNKEYLRLLSLFFFDLGNAVSQTNGEIYKYIGDEAIISWPQNNPKSILMAYRCFRIFQKRMFRRSDIYRSKFSTVPEFRGGLHGGTVIAGSIGEARKEIAYLGDVVNTAARVIDAAKQHGESLVLSAEAYDDLRKFGEFRFKSMGEHTLKGRESKMKLFALELDK